VFDTFHIHTEFNLQLNKLSIIYPKSYSVMNDSYFKEFMYCLLQWILWQL
jgi:hypothetical protein